MICQYRELTDQDWKNCRCGARLAYCSHPARQHPNTPPLDPAGFHSERILDETGEPRTDKTRVNSLYCTAKHCKSYTEEEAAET